MMIFYNIMMNLFMGGVLLFSPVICLFSKKRRSNLLLRSGFGTAWKPKKPDEKRIWIHALSVGEVRSVVPLVMVLCHRYKKGKLIFTASTQTGFETAKQYFLKPDMKFVDQLGYFPFDLGYSVRKICNRIEPDAVIIVETDIWPNFMHEMKIRKIPVVLINARLSKRSLKGYLLFKKYFSTVFSCFTQIMVQTQIDAQRFQSLGIGKEKICVTGNLKFDQAVEDLEGSFIPVMRKRLNIEKHSLVLIAGSTHEGEEDILCRVFKNLKTKYPNLIMILAPRDPGRCKSLLPNLLSKDISAFLLSETNPPFGQGRVILVDEMGILSRLYSLCHIAFIGGSLVKEGGHNPLEPAAFSKPVLFGPDMSDFLWISKLLTDHGGSKQINSETELTHELEALLGNDELQERMGRLNQEVFLRHSGAVGNILKNLEGLHIV